MKPFQGFGARMERNLQPAKLCDLSKIIDSVAVIRVVVGHDHAIDAGNTGGQQLLSKVGAAIHQHGFSAALDRD